MSVQILLKEGGLFSKETWAPFCFTSPATGYLCTITSGGWGAILPHGQSDEIHCIYDTSFLMGDDAAETFAQFDLASESFTGQENACLAGRFRRIIPLQVKREIQSHFGDPEKNTKARRSRNFLAQLLADERSREFDLKASKASPLLDQELGPDSQTDKQIVFYALNCAQSGNACFVATLDGGIRMEIVKQRRKTKLPIFCQSNISDYFAFLDWQTLWQTRKMPETEGEEDDVPF